MKNIRYSLISFLTAGAIFVASCKKESENIYNRFTDVDVNYKSALNNDEVILDFEVSTPTTNPTLNQMFSINIAETGSNTPIVTLPVNAAERNKFAGVVKLKKTSTSPGTYRVWAVSSSGSQIAAATVVFNGGNPVANPVLVSGDTKLVDGQVAYIDYSLNSGKEDIFYVTVEKYPGTGNSQVDRVVTNVLDASKRRSYSGLIKVVANRVGKTSYRIYAQNSTNVYIGDGYKQVTIDVPEVNFILLHNRRIYAPTADGNSQTFYSISKDKSYSYNEGKANSVDIDFGIYTKVDQNPQRIGQLIYNLYSLSNPTNPNPDYNITDWQKRALKFSNFITSSGNVFNYNLSSSSEIETRAKAETLTRSLLEGTQQSNGLAPNTLVYFVTPEGKYGCIFVNALSVDYNGRPYLSISIKVQK
ncbi:hypothetical protein [Desertivirga arenae]|uniref:hypothetical protein n=1 Tax=Desertivirga arenae TaxID=2810309 RepID=UPI001A973544|nr:hypothetical protein [Pedobacter sp. SYSU D00823]